MASVEKVWCGANLLSGIKSMYVDSSACIRVKDGESEWFRKDSEVRQGCKISFACSMYIWM